jgi:hypothetical protein
MMDNLLSRNGCRTRLSAPKAAVPQGARSANVAGTVVDVRDRAIAESDAGSAGDKWLLRPRTEQALEVPHLTQSDRLQDVRDELLRGVIPIPKSNIRN